MTEVIENVIDSGAFDAVRVPYGYMYKTNNTAQQTTLDTGTPAKATITTTAGGLNMFTMPAGNQLKSTSARTFLANVDVVLSGTSSSSTALYDFWIYKNQSVITAVDKSIQLVSAYSDVATIPISTHIEIANGDELELYVEDTLDPLEWDTYAFNMRISFLGWV